MNKLEKLNTVKQTIAHGYEGWSHHNRYCKEQEIGLISVFSECTKAKRNSLLLRFGFFVQNRKNTLDIVM